MDTETFIVVDKPEYDLVLGNNWLIRLEYNINKQDARYWKKNKEKRLYYIRNSIDVLSFLLYIFYELLFLDFTVINSDEEVIIIKFFKYHMVMDHLNLNEYYDLKYFKTNPETESENEYIYSNNMPFHLRYSD